MSCTFDLGGLSSWGVCKWLGVNSIRWALALKLVPSPWRAKSRKQPAMAPVSHPNCLPILHWPIMGRETRHWEDCCGYGFHQEKDSVHLQRTESTRAQSITLISQLSRDVGYARGQIRGPHRGTFCLVLSYTSQLEDISSPVLPASPSHKHKVSLTSPQAWSSVAPLPT